MKKRLFLVCALLALLAVCLCACGEVKQPDTTEAPAITTEAPAITTEAPAVTTEAPVVTTEAPVVTTAPTGNPDCAHQFAEVSYVEPLALKDGEKKFECSLCGGTYVEVVPMTRSIKLLAIGNSFSGNALAYLGDICMEAGVEEVIIGHAKKTSSSIDTHLDNIKNNTAAYSYEKFTNGTEETVSDVTLDHCLLDEEWEIVTLQQRSANSGRQDTYARLDDLIAYVKGKHSDADIYWHMTWACHKDSTSESFEPYDYDQMKMYTKITATVKVTVAKKADIVGIIPAGTVFQNIRTSSIGDNVTAEDGLHASPFGRYVLGLTWYAKLTGGDLDKAYGCPSSEMSTKFVIVKEAIENSFVTPYKVTQSQYK